MSNIHENDFQQPAAGTVPDYLLISPKQFYERINRDLDEPIGLTNVYKLIKHPGFPSVKIGGRFFIMEDKVPEWLHGLTTKRKH